MEMNRRVFMKTVGAAALAVAAAGLLGGCGDNNTAKGYEIALGEFTVRVAQAEIKRSETVNTENASLRIIPTIYVTYTGKGFSGAGYADVFKMKLGDADVAQTTSGTVAGVDFPLVSRTSTYKPEFSAKSRAIYDAYDKGEAMKLLVTLSGQTAVFTFDKNGIVSGVAKA